MITTSSHEKKAIAEAAESVGAKRILEIGVFKGQTTAVLSKAAGRRDGYVIAVDPMTWASKPASIGEHIDAWLHPFSYERAFWRNVAKSGHENVTLKKHLSTDEKLLADPDPRLKEFDLVFVDGEHTYDGAKADVRNWGTRVRPGGLLLLHDVSDRFPGVVKVFRELETTAGYSVVWPRRGTVGIVKVAANAAVASSSDLAAE